jgi:two-component system chemotaxis sensor kinase CheA
MSDDAFFIELQGEFINETLFLLENYEEHMLGLESPENRPEHLAQIFRVAHSVKGGASAVGFTELGKFAHKVEDLLAILRVTPDFVNSEIISVLLKAGDEFKKRLNELRNPSPTEWDPSALSAQVLEWIAKLGGGALSAEHAAAAPAMPSIDEINLALEQDGQIEPPVEVTSNAELEVEAATVTPEAQMEKAQPAEAAPAPVLSLVFENKSSAPATTSAAPKASPITSTANKAEAPGTKKPATVSAATSIKVDLGRIDSVLDAVGEIVVLKNQLVQDDAVKGGSNPRLASVVDQLDKSVRELYEKTLGIRMTPLKSLFLKIQRIVRDVSIQLDKPVNLQILGEETEVERTVFEVLGDPMVHLVRNALDHGIESAQRRQENNKPAMANVTVSAKQSGGQVIIEIKDDGGGIPRDRVLKKAIEKGLLPAGTDPTTLTDAQVYNFLFAPGFSTAEKVSDLSGRGVGLDVVKSNLERVRGKIEVESKLGSGSTFRLLIPLTTAITDGIVVLLQGYQYILPTYSIKEIVRVAPAGFTHLSAQDRVVKIRESLLSVIEVGEIFTLESSKTSRQRARRQRDDQMLVIIETTKGQLALPVDDVLGQTQAVVKPFEIGQNIPEIAGAAVLGDGSTVLILDPQALIQTERLAA